MLLPRAKHLILHEKDVYKRQVLILAEWQYQTIGSELPKLEQAGVPIIVVDFNAQSVERHTQKSLRFGCVVLHFEH